MGAKEQCDIPFPPAHKFFLCKDATRATDSKSDPCLLEILAQALLFSLWKFSSESTRVYYKNICSILKHLS